MRSQIIGVRFQLFGLRWGEARQGLGLGLKPHSSFLLALRAGAGVCARRRSNFLSLRRRVAGRKKVTKERATLLPVTPTLRAGATCDARSRGAGWACAEGHTPSLSDSPWLSECSALARSEFHGAPRDRASQVAPARSVGVTDSRVALSLVTFFRPATRRRRERKLLRRRAHTPASDLKPNKKLVSDPNFTNFKSLCFLTAMCKQNVRW